MAKAVERTFQDGKHAGWMILCPGCGYGHLFDSRWTYNGNPEKPTFSPSMLVNATCGSVSPWSPRCHSFVTDGKIRFLDDCQHKLKGQTVDLEDFVQSRAAGSSVQE